MDEIDLKCFDVLLLCNEVKELFDFYFVYFIDVFYVVVYVLDRSIRCCDLEEKFFGGECLLIKLFKIRGVDFLLYLKNVSFKGFIGVVEFDDYGDLKELLFEIVNI